MAAANNGQAANGVVEKAYTIRVSKLPATLEEEAIQSMFEKYGKVTGIMVFPKKNNTQEAFISYSKYSEAETAINKLDDVAPLSLKIEFKDKELMAKSLQEEIKIRLDKPFLDYRYQQCPLDEQVHLKKAIDMGKPKCTPSAYQVTKYTPDDELLYPVPTDPSMCNPYEQPGPYKDLNLMYSRGIAEILKDGRRRICFGRGYTFYDLPEPHHNIGNLVANICEIRNSGFYEYALDDLDDDSGICKICSSPTAFRCQKCNLTFYCSRPCQLKDWPQHKIDCQAVPNLVKKLPLQKESETTKQNGHTAAMKNGYEVPAKNDYESLPRNQVNAYPREPETQLRRPKSLPQQQQENQQNTPRLTRGQQSPLSPLNLNRNQQQQRSPAPASQEMPVPKSPVSVKSHASSHRSTDVDRQTPVPSFKAESKSFAVREQKPEANRSIPSDDGISFTSPKSWFISKDKFDRVMINTVVEKGEYWIQKVESREIIESLFEKLEVFAKTKRPVDPFVGKKCILEHEGSWYRTIISTVQDNGVTAFFVDFGTFASSQCKGVIPIDGFEDIPTQARKVRFVENTDPKLMNLKIGDTVYIRAVGIVDTGTFSVEAKEDTEKIEAEEPEAEKPPQAEISVPPKAPVPETERQPSPRQIAIEKLAGFPSILNCLEAGQEGVIILHAQLSGNELNASLIPFGAKMDQFESLVDKFGKSCAEGIAKNPNYEPIIGDFICGENDNGDWFRGIVISLKPVKLAVVDEARVFVPVRCTTLPKDYHEIVGYGLLVKLAANAELASTQGTFKVLQTSESKDSAVIKVELENNYAGDVTLSKWTPKPEQKGIQWTKLTSGRDVKIIEAFTHNLIYVQSMESEEVERHHRLQQAIAKCALTRKPLRELPVVGQLVMAYYENDRNYYRAYVVKVASKTNIQIKYIDYGNDENVKFEQLFELPDDLKEERACAARIKLKGIEENIPMTEDATSYLSELIVHEVALTCTFTGNPAQDGVVLKTPKNDIVNDLLSSYLKPTWQQNNTEDVIDKPIFLINNLPCLKIGDVGDQVQAIALCFYEDPPNLMLAPNDETCITAIQQDLHEKIQEYAKKTPKHYIPRERELCIAMYNDEYFRAVCMHSSASPTESRVTFIDYGNTEVVKHKDIRLMTQDFMGVGPLATLCSISPMVPDDKITPAITKRLSELLPINELITVKIISEDSSDGTPYIDIPEIRVKLIDENLL